MNIFTFNPDTSDLEKTYLSNATAQGATVFKVKNGNNFTNGRKVLVGRMGQERSEILTMSGVTATQLTLSAAQFPHDADDPIYELDYDKIRFYRSTTGENGTYTLLSGGEVAIDVDNLNNKTYFDDPNALPAYWYHSTFYDSIDAVESGPSNNMQITGYPEGSLGSAILQFVGEVNDRDFMIFAIEDYIGIANNVNKDLTRAAKRPYRFLKTSRLLDALEGLDYVALPTDLWKTNYTEINQVSSPGVTQTFRADYATVSPEEMRYLRSIDTLDGDLTNKIAIDDETDRLLFTPAARVDRIGAFRLHYYKKFTTFTSMADLVETPDDLVYQLAFGRKFYLRKMDDDSKYRVQYTEYDKMYNAEIVKLQREKNINAGAPTSMGPDRRRYLQHGGLRRYRQ